MAVSKAKHCINKRCHQIKRKYDYKSKSDRVKKGEHSLQFSSRNDLFYRRFLSYQLAIRCSRKVDREKLQVMPQATCHSANSFLLLPSPQKICLKCNLEGIIIDLLLRIRLKIKCIHSPVKNGLRVKSQW